MVTAATAIEWMPAPPASPDAPATPDPYWSGLERLVEAIGGVEGCRNDEEDGPRLGLTFPIALYLVARLARLLSDRIVAALRDADTHDRGPYADLLSVSVVVAIPEGVYLPLAVAAVHALNRPRPLGGAGRCRFHAVLVPLDPSDAPGRVRAVLRDAGPCLILVATRCDLDRLQALLAERPALSGGAARQPSMLYTASDPQLVDVPSILADVEPPTAALMASVDEQLRQVPTLSLDDMVRLCERLLDATCHDGDADDETGEHPNVVSHVCFTSGTTGTPKGCVSSRSALRHYVAAKTTQHEIDASARVLLASGVAFDPCLSDVLATLGAGATLLVSRRTDLLRDLPGVLRRLGVTHCLCTPTLWGTTLLATASSAGGDDDKENGGKPPTALYTRFPALMCVALGGERIPDRLRAAWARPVADTGSKFRFCATYGVTEACVYQTIGEVRPEVNSGTDVGLPFPGMGVRICVESDREELVDVETSASGEVVLHGNQLDEFSCYLDRPDLSARQFVRQGDEYCYRTGDRGYIHPDTKRLHILGRIDGEHGMVKVNGVRIELAEIEASVIDRSDSLDVIFDCIVVAEREPDQADSTSARGVVCYIVLSPKCKSQMGIYGPIPERGAVCLSGPLLALVHHRCKEVTKILPSAIVVIPRIPLSATGKRDREGTPGRSEWISLSSLLPDEEDNESSLLEAHGRLGKVVSDIIVDCLNLQEVQKSMLTSSVTFGMVGGDSLAATRVTRALYALHHNIPNSRFIGGEFGALDGAFAASNLLSAANLGVYVDWLEQSNVCVTDQKPSMDPSPDEKSESKRPRIARNDAEELYAALFRAATRKYTNIGLALLDLGADPNYGAHKGRLAKVSGRLERKRVFHSSPLHIACIRGDVSLTQKLIDKGAAWNTPDASGLFPLHLVVIGEPGTNFTHEDERRRIQIFDILLDAGAALPMKDGQKQTIIHVAARSGRRELLLYIVTKWKERYAADPRKVGSLDWRDNWGRTAVHWAVLNGHVETLEILLQSGCDPDPVKPKCARGTSLIWESPAELCVRLFGSQATGEKIRTLLQKYKRSI